MSFHQEFPKFGQHATNGKTQHDFAKQIKSPRRVGEDQGAPLVPKMSRDTRVIPLDSLVGDQVGIDPGV
jgi:hypothetical protein